MKKLLFSLCIVAFTVALMLCSFAAETVIYENDFSDPTTLGDFKQYSFEWKIKDGGLYYTGNKTNSSANFGHILYNGYTDLTDYTVEVDYMNVQTAGGVIFRADLEKADETSNGYYGYHAFIANDANKGAFGCPDAAGAWKNNINVGAAGDVKIGSNIHIKVTVKGNDINVVMTNIDTGRTVYTYNYTVGSSENDGGSWQKGTFGFRIRDNYTKNAVNSANTAYFDNLKVTAVEKVEVDDSETSPEIVADYIDTSSLIPVYTNNFEKFSDIADFKQYRGTWATYNGRLYLSAASGSQSYILYAGDEEITKLTDYVIDVDMYNTQTQGGAIIRSDLANVTGKTDDGIMGYMGFISNDGKFGAIGAGLADGKWLSGNIEVSESAIVAPGSDIHLQLAVKGNVVQLTITEQGTGKILWKHAEVNELWKEGTFGLRLRGSTSNGMSNITTACFDNLVVSKFGEPVAKEKVEVKMTIGSLTAYVNGEAKTLDAAPLIRQNRTMLPVRFLADAFGAKVEWDGETSTATLISDEATIVIVIYESRMTVNGVTVPLDSPAVIQNNRTYLPVRAIAEALGANVAWDAETSTAILTK